MKAKYINHSRLINKIMSLKLSHRNFEESWLRNLIGSTMNNAQTCSPILGVFLRGNLNALSEYSHSALFNWLIISILIFSPMFSLIIIYAAICIATNSSTSMMLNIGCAYPSNAVISWVSQQIHVFISFFFISKAHINTRCS